VTCKHLAALGIQPGWRCWEVGAGGPSLLVWLSEQVGPRGRVLATDIDTSWLEDEVDPVLEVRRHDVAHDHPPGEQFDLIHARLVLVHVPDRDRALRQIVASLRPGGVLLLEDYDVLLQPLACPHPCGSEHTRANLIRAGFLALLAQRGADLSYGRTLPARLRAVGLDEVIADAYWPLALPAAGALEAANINQVRTQLIAHGHASAEEIDAHLAALAQAELDIALPPLISARGRRQANRET
jgi:SAM-dependent methyltransferase